MLTPLLLRRAVAALVAVPLLVTPACNVSRGCPEETTLTVKPASGKELAELRVEARLTSEGRPVPGRRIGFSLFTAEDSGRFSYEERTDVDGVAFSSLRNELDTDYTREMLRQVRYYKAYFEPITGPLCGSTGTAPFTFSG